MKIIMLGMPGSGKDTQAQVLEKKYHLRHISPGEIFRKEMEKKTDLGIKIDSIMKSGRFVDDETTINIIKQEIDGKDDFILNEFPRNIEQAKWLDTYFEKSGNKIDAVLFLDITEQAAKERIKSRFAEIKRPEDASEELIKKRFDIYYEVTFPLIEYYKDKVISIQSSLSREMISNIINAVIKGKKPNARYF